MGPSAATDIERALDELVRNQAGFVFQRLALQLIRNRHSDAVATEPTKDLGEDAILYTESGRIAFGCSITGTQAKIQKDVEKACKHKPKPAFFIFYTPLKITRQTWQPWELFIADNYGVQLVVVTKEEIVESLLRPENAWIAYRYLSINLDLRPTVAAAFVKAHAWAEEAAALRSLKWPADVLIELGLTRSSSVNGELGGREVAATIDLILRAFERTRSTQYVLSGIKRLLVSGVALPSDRIASILDRFISENLQRPWPNESGQYIVKECVCLLSLLDDLDTAETRIRSLFFERKSWEVRDICDALGWNDSERASDLLVEIGAHWQEIGDSLYHSWASAVVRYPHERAKDLLLSLIDPARKSPVKLSSMHAWERDPLVSGVGNLARRDTEFRRRILSATSATANRRAKSEILIAVLEKIGSEEAAIAAVNILSKENHGAIQRFLEHVFCEHRPISEHATAYEILGRAANPIRELLYSKLSDGAETAALALDLLAQIELWRLVHGKPLDEPFHPRIESGGSWTNVLAGVASVS